MPKAQMPKILTRQSRLGRLPAFAESPVRKGGVGCEKGIHRSLGEGGSASAGSAEDVKMPRAAARGGMARGDRGVARKGEAGWLRRSSAWLRHRCPARERGELQFNLGTSGHALANVTCVRLSTKSTLQSNGLLSRSIPPPGAPLTGLRKSTSSSQPV